MHWFALLYCFYGFLTTWACVNMRGDEEKTLIPIVYGVLWPMTYLMFLYFAITDDEPEP